METSEFSTQLGTYDYAPGSRILRNQTPMMRGDDVRYVQLRVGATPDGIFGPETERQVRFYQMANFISPTGVVDNYTWLSLAEEPVPGGGSSGGNGGGNNTGNQDNGAHTKKTLVLLGIAAIATGVFIANTSDGKKK